MRKLLLILVLLFISSVSHAVELEVSIGQGHFNKTNATDWWQEGPASEGFKDNVNLSVRAVSVGLTDKFADGWRWRVNYTQYGSINSDAWATHRDDQYDTVNRRCKPGCVMTRYIGESHIDGVWATIAKEYQIGIATVYPEVGIGIRRVQFSMYTTDDMGNPYRVPLEDNYNLGWLAGFGIKIWHLALSYDVRQAERTGQLPANFQGNVSTFWLRSSIPF